MKSFMNRLKPILVMLAGRLVNLFAWLLARTELAVRKLKTANEATLIVDGPVSYGPSDQDEPSLVISSSMAEAVPDANEPVPDFAPQAEQAEQAETYGTEFVDTPEEDTSTDFIYRKANPVDLSELPTRPATEALPPPVPAWEVQIAGETLGPFTRQEILDGLNDGAFPNDIKVRELPSEEWLSAVVLIVSKPEDEAA